MKILLAADGSEFTTRAAEWLAKACGQFAKPPEIHVLHVHAPLPYPGAATAIGDNAIYEYQRDESREALAVAERVLRKAGLAFESTWHVGEVAPTVAEYADRHAVDLVVIGSHGHGALMSLALGSVASKLVASVKVPLLVVTPP